MDPQFQQLAARFLDEYPAISPVTATSLGDHRFDDQLDQVSPEARERQREFCNSISTALDKIDWTQLSRSNQVDYQLVRQYIHRRLWELDRLQSWAWNPLLYTRLVGGSIYGLMAREFAPADQRLRSVAARLEQLPRLYDQVRATLVPARVPRVHAETAVKQNRGLLSILQHMVRPRMAALSAVQRSRLEQAIETATAAVDKQQRWLEDELVTNASGDYRLGAELYDEKLALTLETRLTRSQIRELAESELVRVRTEMYEIARRVRGGEETTNGAGESPSREQQQATIEAGLELAYGQIPGRDQIVATAERSLEITTRFVRERNLATLPPDPLEIIVMPEFQRGVSVAYCDSPGPLEVGQKTFYAVAPLPDDWSDEQCRSFLREYNTRSIHNLTVHEAMPGHFWQLAYSNRYPSPLRAILSSGVFVEGWACYSEQMMSEEGFLDRDPLMRLVTLKWYLRTMANALLDQAVHVDGIDRDTAMRLMQEDTFQEEREAAGKWTRAQLTSVQLSTYFVGYHEHRAMRRAAEAAWDADFNLRRYHDGVVSFGSPPTRYVQALLLDQPIPE